MIQRYYKNLFTDEGYLTNVLPVSATDHILAKMLVFGAWNILNGLSVLASVSFLILPSAIQYFSGHSLILNNQAVTFSDFLNYVWTQITCVADAAFSLIGITSRLGMALFSIVGFFASLFFGILLIYACISIGSLVSNHKILTAVLSFIGLSTAIQTFGGIGIVQIFQDFHTACCGYDILGFHACHHCGTLCCPVPDLPLYLKQTAESFIKIALKSAAADEPNRLRRRFVCMFCTYARCQISSLYCAMVRSEEKKPAFAMLIRHFLFHASLFS